MDSPTPHVKGSEDPMDLDEQDVLVDEPDSLACPLDASESQKDGVNLKELADDYVKYLIVNSKEDQTALDDRIDGVYTRVDEFKQQLYFLHQNISSSSDKMQELQDNTEHLVALFQKIDQMEAFINLVDRDVDRLEEAVSQGERALEPSRLRKVFFSIPGFGKKPSPKPDSVSNWNSPKIFRSKDYFVRRSSATHHPTPPSLVSSSASSFSGQSDEQVITPQEDPRVLLPGQQKTGTSEILSS